MVTIELKSGKIIIYNIYTKQYYIAGIKPITLQDLTEEEAEEAEKVALPPLKRKRFDIFSQKRLCYN